MTVILPVTAISDICNYTSDSDSDITIVDKPTITEFDPVHKHPEEDQEIKPRENLEITPSDPIQPGENLDLTPLIYYN